ncbi:hypothetical protein [Bacillus sp. AFS055030]|uniref:hypothetical protein n=1 Tax=Bacillus sp. AFS055030 TaxID=2033507 RepID=UPI000BFCDD92|nr:hypothetical protein [Bacillus sp. AFS055030]PGL67862.1 hypothetical protein CN925_18025 [Bacillus sp. AFS055030]
MGDGFVLISFIMLCAVAFFTWAIISINNKLRLLIKINLKQNDTHFNDKYIEEEIEKYRDK